MPKRSVATLWCYAQGRRCHCLYPSRPGLLGVRRVRPGERQPAVPGWNVLQLLALFRVGKLVDVPWAEETMLAQLPLQQLWPSLKPAMTSRAGSSRLLSPTPMHSCGSLLAAERAPTPGRLPPRTSSFSAHAL